jgi:hypothetical protein
MKKKIVVNPPAPIKFPRADPEALAKFDPRTKQCTMNCGPHRDDPRSEKECKFLCDDCVEVDVGYIESLEEKSNRLQEIYTQRNNCAIAFAKAAVAAGWKAGRGIDSAALDEAWAHVVYIDLPDGRQVSYHINPDQVHMLNSLPVYDGQWDGTFVGRESDWAGW